jgi:CheY-like chemotaxis protein
MAGSGSGADASDIFPEAPGPSQGEPSHRPDPLTRDEMQSLLDGFGNGTHENGDETPARSVDPCVLVVSRRDDEVRMLRGVLGSRGIRVVAVRNPFSALDQLRLRRHVGVISDFDVWADSGALLFSRLNSDAGAALPVVFICDGPRARASALATPAAGVLELPLDAGTIVDASKAWTGVRAAPRTASDEVPPRAAPAVAGSGGIGTDRAAEEPCDVVWLRFFFDCRRAMRSAAPGRDRMMAILACFRSGLGRPCGIGVALEDGWWIIAVPGSGEVIARIGDVLGNAFGGALESSGPGEAPAPGSVAAGGLPPLEIVVPVKVGGRPAVFLALPAGEGSRADLVPEIYRGEISALIEEAGMAAGMDREIRRES